MARNVYKYPINFPNLDLPAGAKILHFAAQNHTPTIWAEVDSFPGPSTQRRIFHVVGTGMGVPAMSVHRGTCMDGPYVWHLYEVI